MYRKLAPITLTLALLAGGAFGQRALQGVAPFVDQETVLLLHVDLTQIDVAALARKYQPDRPADVPEEQWEQLEAQSEQVQTMAQDWITQFKQAGGRDIYVIASQQDFDDEAPVMVIPLAANADAAALQAFMEQTLAEADGQFATMERIGDALVAGSAAQIERMQEFDAQANAALTAAVQAVGDAPVQAAFVMTEDLRQEALSDTDDLPPDIAPDMIATVEGLQWVAFAFNPDPASLKLVVQEESEAGARAADALVAAAFEQMGPQIGQFFPDIDAMLAMLRPQVRGNQLVLTLNEQQLTTLVQEHLVPAFNNFMGMMMGGAVESSEGDF